MTIYSFTIRHSFPNLLYVTYLHDVLYVCATSILFLFSQRDHNENKVYPDLYYAIPATVFDSKTFRCIYCFCKVVFLYSFIVPFLL